MKFRFILFLMTAYLAFLYGTTVYVQGLFLSRKVLSEKNKLELVDLARTGEERWLLQDEFGDDVRLRGLGRKMLVVLVDALREDMIEGDFLNYDFGFNVYKMKFFN
jgi:hypothetical protein